MATFSKPSLNGKAKKRITREQATYLCRLVRSHGWSDRAFVRLLRFRGVYATEDLWPWDYAHLIVAVNDPTIRDACEDASVNLSDGRRRERAYHTDLERSAFYVAYSLSLMDDDDVWWSVCMIELDPELAALAFRELKHRLDSYRMIAKILEVA